MGKTPLKVKCIKKKKEEMQFLSNCVLRSKTIAHKVEIFLRKCHGEYFCSIFNGWTILQIDDPVMYHLSDVMYMDLNVFVLLSMH